MNDRLIKGLLVLVGSVFIGLGIIGIVVPLLPTTPFLLLAAACFARGSQRFYGWLMQNRWLGAYIRSYPEESSMPLKVKIFSIALLWVTISFSIMFFVSNFFLQLILFGIVIIVSIHILTIKTLEKC